MTERLIAYGAASTIDQLKVGTVWWHVYALARGSFICEYPKIIVAEPYKAKERDARQEYEHSTLGDKYIIDWIEARRGTDNVHRRHTMYADYVFCSDLGIGANHNNNRIFPTKELAEAYLKDAKAYFAAHPDRHF